MTRSLRLIRALSIVVLMVMEKTDLMEKGALDDSIQRISGIANLNELVLGERDIYQPLLQIKPQPLLLFILFLLHYFIVRERAKVREVEVPMFESMVFFTMAEHIWGEIFEPALGPAGYTRLMSHHRKPYKTKDGYIAVLPYVNNLEDLL